MDALLHSGFAWTAWLWVGGLALLILQRAPRARRAWSWVLGPLVLASALLWSLLSGPQAEGGAVAAFRLDAYALFVQVFVMAVALAGTLLAHHAGKAFPAGGSGLLLMSTAGACLMAMSVDLVSLPAGLTATWLPLAGLAVLRRDEQGREAALKAVLLLLCGVSLFAMGAALLAARSGTTGIDGLSRFFSELDFIGRDPLLVLSLGMLLVASLLFVAALPLHMGLTDAVQGLPASGALLLSGGGLAALLAVLSRIILVAFGSLQESGPGYLSWASVLHVVGLVSLIGGHAMALVQPRLKRMLACLASGQVGMVLVALAATGQLGHAPAEQQRALAGVLVFLAVHAVNWIGVFLAVSAVCASGEGDPGVRRLDGLARRHPALAAAVSLSLLCMAGLPLTAGFIPRLVLLEGMIVAGWVGTAIITALSLGLVLAMSLGLVAAMMMRPGSSEVEVRSSWSLNLTALLASAAILLMGLWPGGILAWGLAAASVVGG